MARLIARVPRVLGVGLAVVLLASVGGLAQTPSTAPTGAGKIAFTSNRDGSDQIYTMDMDGSNVVRLTNLPGVGAPQFSPDGTRMIFTSSSGGPYTAQIYVMKVDGSGLTRLTSPPGESYHPAFSPDGTKIVFVSSREGGSFIYVMNADGSGVTRLTKSPGSYMSASFSPDGRKVICWALRDGYGSGVYNADAAQIYVMNADGRIWCG